MPTLHPLTTRLTSGLAIAAICALPFSRSVAQGGRIETRTAPVPPPAGVNIRAGSASSVVVSWTPVATPAKYRVLRSTDATKTGTDLSTALIAGPPFTDASPVPGMLYFYSVVAVYADGRQGASAPVQFTLPAPPKAIALVDPRRIVVSQVSPNPLPSGLKTLLVKGGGFGNITDVRVGGVHQAYGKDGCGSTASPDSVMIITLAGPVKPGPNTIEFVGAAGTNATTAQFTIAQASIDAQGVNPPYAKAGEWVTISGYHLADQLNFHSIGNCTTVDVANPSLVTFNGNAATATTTDGITIRAQVPAHATGRVSVGSRWFGSGDWAGTFVEVPVIITVPASAQAGGSVGITGTGMDAVDSVKINGGKMAITDKRYTSISFAVPVDIVDRTLSLSVTLFAKIARGFVPVTGAPVGQDLPMIQFLPLRRITKVTPDSGSPGDGVTLTGVGLTDAPPGSNSNWVPAVWFNGVGSPSTSLLTAYTVGSMIPKDATTGPVTLAQGRYAPQITGPVVRVIRTPKFTGSGVYPSGAQVGSPVQIYIQSGSDPTSISFGGFVVTSGWTVAPGSGLVDLTISLKLPAGAKTGPIVVTTKDGSTTWKNATPFTVYP
jgi:hypothetical protein